MAWYLAYTAVTDLYRSTTLGIFWLFARPLLPILIGTLVFGQFLQVPSDGIPYFLFFLVGSTAWLTFERCVLTITRSLSQNRGLLTQVYFPRLLIPTTAAAPALVNFGIYVLLIAGALLYYLFTASVWYLVVGPRLLAAMFAMFLIVVFAIGLGFWTTVFEARHRDVRFALRYVLRFWSYLTPVIYPMSQVPPEHRWLLYVNPMAPLVEIFKWGTLGVGSFPSVPLVSAVLVIIATCASGIWFFTWTEGSLIDKI